MKGGSVNYSFEGNTYLAYGSFDSKVRLQLNCDYQTDRRTNG